MKKRLSTHQIATLAICPVWLALTLPVMPGFTGSVALLACYSMLFLLLVLDCVWRPVGMGYFFLVSFITLGFWAKLMLHLWMGYKYLEPTGLFDYSAGQWNQVLLVTMCGVAGLLLAKLVVGQRFKQNEVAGNGPPLPSWYVKWRYPTWFLTAAAIFLSPYVNEHLGIARSHLIPALVLPWPLNGLFGWFLGFGLIAWILALAGWEQRMQRSWVPGFVAVMAEAYFSAVSSLSRASYIFHTVPYVWNLVTRYLTGKWKRIQIFLVFTVWLMLLGTSLRTVMVARYFPATQTAEASAPAVEKHPPTNQEKSAGAGTIKPLSTSVSFVPETLLSKVSLLVVDRWIGLEGVMAVVAYPDKSLGLLAKAAGERRGLGKLDIFTAEIAKASLPEEVLRHIQYATIPGAVAFFYYSGSLIFVLLGVAILTTVLLVSDWFILRLTQNPYLSSFWGMTLALTVASFGLGVIQSVTFYLVSFAFMVIIWLLQGRQGLNRHNSF